MAEPIPTPTTQVGSKSPLTVRRALIELLVGCALGMLLVGLLGPSLLSWWYEPPSKDAFSCAGSVRDALGKFVLLQVGTALFFAVSAVIVSFLVRRRFR